MKKILAFVLLFFLIDSAFSCCCVPSVSCKLVKITVSAAVSQTIAGLKQNDIELYSKKLQKLNNIIKDINELEVKIKENEKKLIPIEKTEAFYIVQKRELLKKIIRIEKLIIAANNILATSKISEKDLLLLKINKTK